MKVMLLKIIGFPLLGLFSAGVFLMLTFPEEKVQILVQRNFEKVLDYEYRVEAVEFDFGFLSGIEMKQITLTPRFSFEEDDIGDDDTKASAMAEPDPESLEAQYFCPRQIEPSPVLIDAIRANPSWTAAIGGAVESTFEVELAGGTIAGSVESGDEGAKVAAAINNVAMQRFTLMRNKLAMHMIGMFGGNIDLTFGEGMRLEGGAIDVRLGGVVLCPKKFKLAMPNVPFFEMPLTRMGNIAGRVEVTENRRLEFKNFEGEGEDMDLKVEGYIQLANERIPKTRYDIRIRLTPDPKWVEENMMEALFKICRRFDDGSIQFVVTGEAGNTKRNCIKAQGGAPQARRSTPPPPRRTPPPRDEPDEVVEPPTPTPARATAQQPARVATPRPNQDLLNKRRNAGSVARTRNDPRQRPVNAASLKGRVKPVPTERGREVLKVYDR